MKEVKIERLHDDHPAKAHGFNFSASIYVNDTYCGNGRYFKTRKEAEAYKIKEQGKDIEQ